MTKGSSTPATAAGGHRLGGGERQNPVEAEEVPSVPAEVAQTGVVLRPPCPGPQTLLRTPPTGRGRSKCPAQAAPFRRAQAGVREASRNPFDMPPAYSHEVETPVGARLGFFIKAWKKVTADPWGSENHQGGLPLGIHLPASDRGGLWTHPRPHQRHKRLRCSARSSRVYWQRRRSSPSMGGWTI